VTSIFDDLSRLSSGKAAADPGERIASGPHASAAAM
jgi:hypothetical protein